MGLRSTDGALARAGARGTPLTAVSGAASAFEPRAHLTVHRAPAASLLASPAPLPGDHPLMTPNGPHDYPCPACRWSCQRRPRWEAACELEYRDEELPAASRRRRGTDPPVSPPDSRVIPP